MQLTPTVMVWLLGLLLSLLALLLWKTIGSATNPLDWADLITEHGSRHVALKKVGLVVGIVIGSWVVVTMAYSGKLTWEVFAAYFAFVGTTEGYSTYLRSKYGPRKTNAEGLEQ